MKILLLSAYDADSHQYWRKQLVLQFPEYQWTVLSLPARYFAWRIRGNSLSWAFGPDREVLEQDYDLLICTSMTDLSALRGMLPSLGKIPTLVYFHENQFAYPQSDNAHKSVEPQILNIYTAACADKIVFNTGYNRDTFLQGARKLLKKLPDQVPAGLITQLERKSQVLAVPLESAVFNNQPDVSVNWQTDNQQCIKIAWAARWEYDKGPQQLLAILNELEIRRIDFKISLLGQNFRHSPEIFSEIKDRFEHRLAQYGYASSREEYLVWLGTADVFLSTALHEFQGLSVLEAVARNCFPVLPGREVYPSLFPADYIYTSNFQNPAEEARSAADLIISQASRKHAGNPAPQVDTYSWQSLRSDYQQIIEQLTATS